jgi:hypothetical protein
MISTAFSIASFSIVLAECFAMVGMSTLIPTGAAVAASTIRHAALENKQTPPGTTPAQNDPLGQLLSFGGSIASAPVEGIKQVIRTVAHDMDSISLLVPKSASIDAVFKFHANESYSMNAEGGAMIQLVTVKAGYSALFAVETSNEVKLHVDFALVNFDLTSDKPGVIKFGTATKDYASVDNITAGIRVRLRNLGENELTFKGPASTIAIPADEEITVRGSKLGAGMLEVKTTATDNTTNDWQVVIGV